VSGWVLLPECGPPEYRWSGWGTPLIISIPHTPPSQTHPITQALVRGGPPCEGWSEEGVHMWVTLKNITLPAELLCPD